MKDRPIMNKFNDFDCLLIYNLIIRDFDETSDANALIRRFSNSCRIINTLVNALAISHFLLITILESVGFIQENAH